MTTNKRNVWVHPTVMHGKYGPQINLSEAYQDGFQTGANWKQNYQPCGPFISLYCHNLNQESDWKAYCDHSRAVYDEWQRGFKDGKYHSLTTAFKCK
jgi:hypothetical protein